MDTGSHLLFGVTLAGMAFFLPEVVSEPQLAAAVLSVTIVGSTAPDFDSVLRIKSQDAYLKNHRGWSHSLPAWPLWSMIIGSLAAWGWGLGEHLLLLCGFAFAAVVLHVLSDLTNAYGVQIMRPFRREWFHLDAICLTDPFLVVIHSTAAIGVITGMWPYPQWISAGTWGLTFAYVAWRIVHHEVVVKKVKRRYRRWRAIHVLPGLWWFKWQYVVQTNSGFEMGVVDGERLLPSRHLPFSVPHDCVEATRHLSVVRTLQDFAKREYVSWKAEPDGGYLVTWTDLRFWREKDWPYRAEVRLDDQFNVLDEQIGWYKKAWEAPYV
jgi:inner membrane protein